MSWFGVIERLQGGAEPRMHLLTLHFPQPLEAEFQSEYFDRTLTQVRLALVVGALLYSAFGVLDTWIAPGQRHDIWIIRYGIVDPLALCLIAFTYTRAFRRYREPPLAFVVLVASLGVVAMTAMVPPPNTYVYYAGLVAVVGYLFSLVRMSVTYATGVFAITTAAYLFAALRINAMPRQIVDNNLWVLVTGGIIGFVANYSMERYARINFLQQRLIEVRTTELEQKNDELIAKNRMLAESRAATIRTAQRSELIFSALSEALPGTVLDGKYKVEDKIGSGNFGTVYRGEHILLHHPVAIKVFRPAVGQVAADRLDRFRLEGISACRINHPNAVTVLDFDVSAGSLAYLVMELLEGQSLADEMRTKKKIDSRHAAEIGVAVCDVLAEAHAAGIVHRDIKPSNVFLHRHKGTEQVKVIDFGIARLTDESVNPDAQRITGTGTFVGTPVYIAPERWLNESYDGRADVYAVGVMLYEMLCGRLPFDIRGSNTLAIARMHAIEPPTSVTAIEPSVSAELGGLVLRALAKEPEQRPTAIELGVELRHFLEHAPSTPSSHTLTPAG